MELTVSKLRYILNAALEQLEDYNDSDVVLTKINTRYVGTPFIGVPNGYIDLNDIEVEEPWDDDEFDESCKYKSLRDRKFEAADSELIYQDDLWNVYKINSKEAARRYGIGTDWYILTVDDFGNDVFDNAVDRSDIYFYIKKKGNKKYCLYKDKNNGSVSISDKSDEDVPLKIIKLEEPKFPSISGVFNPPAVGQQTRNIEKLVNAIADNKIDVVNNMINSGIDVNARCSAGTAPLHVALMYNRIDMVKALLEAGADPNMPGNEKYPGWTNPLKNAINDRRPALVALLKQYGAHE